MSGMSMLMTDVECKIENQNIVKNGDYDHGAISVNDPEDDNAKNWLPLVDMGQRIFKNSRSVNPN